MSTHKRALDPTEIAAVEDAAIDFTDIPELDETFWREARLVEPDRTEQITLRVKRSVLEHFRASFDGGQMAVEPVGNHRSLFLRRLPPVTAPGLSIETVFHSLGLKPFEDALRLLDRHAFVRIAMDQQRRRVVRADVIERRDIPIVLRQPLFVRHPGEAELPGIVVEQVQRLLERIAAVRLDSPDRVVDEHALGAEVQEVRRRKVRHDSLDPAVLFSQSPGPLQQRKVPPGRSTHHADPRRVDPIALGVLADVPDGRADLPMDLRDGELRLGAVDDQEQRVAARQQFRRIEDGPRKDARQLIGRPRRQERMAGHPPTAHQHQHRRAVRLRDGRDAIHRERVTALPVIDEVEVTHEGWRVRGAEARGRQCREDAEQESASASLEAASRPQHLQNR